MQVTLPRSLSQLNPLEEVDAQETLNGKYKSRMDWQCVQVCVRVSECMCKCMYMCVVCATVCRCVSVLVCVSVCGCTNVCKYVCRCVHMCVCAQVFGGVCAQVCECLSVVVSVCVSVDKCVGVCKSVCGCVCRCAHVVMCVCKCADVYECVFTGVCKCVQVCAHTCVHKCVHVCMCEGVCASVSACGQVCECAHLWVGGVFTSWATGKQYPHNADTVSGGPLHETSAADTHQCCLNSLQQVGGGYHLQEMQTSCCVPVALPNLLLWLSMCSSHCLLHKDKLEMLWPLILVFIPLHSELHFQ